MKGLSGTKRGDMTGTGGNTSLEINGHKGVHHTGDRMNDMAWRVKGFEQKSPHNEHSKSANR